MQTGRPRGALFCFWSDAAKSAFARRLLLAAALRAAPLLGALATLLPLRLLTGPRLLGPLASGSLLALRLLTRALLLRSLATRPLLPLGLLPRTLPLGTLTSGPLLALRLLGTLTAGALLLLALRLLPFTRPLLLGALTRPLRL
jgi:hypothetical protein